MVKNSLILTKNNILYAICWFNPHTWAVHVLWFIRKHLNLDDKFVNFASHSTEYFFFYFFFRFFCRSQHLCWTYFFIQILDTEKVCKDFFFLFPSSSQHRMPLQQKLNLYCCSKKSSEYLHNTQRMRMREKKASKTMMALRYS